MNEIDHELVERFVRGELDGVELVRVRTLTRDDPTWKAALSQALEVQLALFEVADALRAEQRAPQAEAAVVTRRRPWWLWAAGLVAASVPVWWMVSSPTTPYAVGVQVRGTPLGECRLSGSTTLGTPEPATAAQALCAGQQIVLTFRPDRATSWEEPAVLLDDTPITCATAALGTQGAGTVTCEAGRDFELQPGSVHRLQVRWAGGRHIVELTDGAPP